MKIVAAIDSFKGSMSSETANQAVQKALPMHEVVSFPIADGGEGTVEAIVALEKGEIVTQDVTGVNGKEMSADWGWIQEKKTAVIEVAEAAGLTKANHTTFHPRNHTSYGVGQQILQAIDKGAETLILGLGGSATVDGGMGMMQALGVVFRDAAGRELPYLPVELEKVETVDLSGLDDRLKNKTWIVASDVNNPLCGENGAAYVYGPQKGLKADELAAYDQWMKNYGQKVQKAVGREEAHTPGAGAAGGIGFALLSFFDCQFESGLELIAKRGNLREKLADADIVVTGEGKFDTQSFHGKAPTGISAIASEEGIPTIVFAGKIDGDLFAVPKQNIRAVLPIVDAPMSLDEAMTKGPELLEKAVKRAFQLIELFERE